MLTQRRLDYIHQQQQRELAELRTDIEEGKKKIMGNLHDLIKRDCDARARKSLARISTLAWQIEHDPEEMKRIAQDASEAPYHQYRMITAQHEYKQQRALLQARNQQAARQGW